MKRSANAMEPVLVAVAFLRITLVDRNDFPGHTFPWNGTDTQRAAAIRALREWW